MAALSGGASFPFPSGGKIAIKIATDNVEVAKDVLKTVRVLGFTAVTLGGLYFGYKLLQPLIGSAVTRGLGGKRDDQGDPKFGRGSLRVLLHCFTDERFLEVLADYESGRMKERLQEEFSQIGIKVEGLKVEIENMVEVNETKEAISKRYHVKTDLCEDVKNVVITSAKSDVEKHVQRMASPSKTLNDQANGARLSQLLVNKGTQALRAAFDFMYPPSTLTAVLNTNKAILQKLRYKVIIPSQWKLLYPSSGTPDSKNFDLTLLTVLLRNICGLTRPASGWDALPPDSDTSVAANIARIKFYRNQVYAHITTTEIADNEFKNLWLKISKALIGLGIPKYELDELKEAPRSPEEADYIQQLQDWCKNEDEMNVLLKEILARVGVDTL